jgi:predicted O-methyltransferase YrrM
MEQFSVDWTTANFQNWQKWLGHLIGRPARGLEVGCFEGRASIWFLDNILTHKDSELCVIDTFKNNPGFKQFGADGSDLLNRFTKNIGHRAIKVRIFEGRSSDVLREDLTFARGANSFDFAYIDGSHASRDVLGDAVRVYDLVKPGGVIIFDDYGWSYSQSVKEAVEAFLGCYKGGFKNLEVNYQVAFKKI